MNDNATRATDREERLGVALAEWLEAAERGAPPEEAEYLRRYPELAEELARCFTDWRRFPRPGAPAASGALPERGLLGDYRIVREVGRGGMGVVYEALQVSLDRRVALKVLPFAATMDPRQLARFHNEARAAASLEHPHIVPVYGVGCERGVHFYAMKFIDGHSLAELIARQAAPGSADPTTPYAQARLEADTKPRAADATAPVPRDAAFFRRAAQWGVEAAEALEHAHSLGVVHRDVKPANLLIDEQGQLWVADFGLARTAADTGLTMTGDVLGTLRYMSPEQALARHGLVDHRTDVYALGATLYELLAGRPAVEGKDRAELLHNIAFEEPRALNRTIPVELETVVLKCLAKEPAERYASAKELADDLRRFLDDRPVLARRPGLARRAANWARRHRALAASAVAVLALAVVALAVSTALIWREKQTTKEALDQKAEALDQAEARTRFARGAANTLYTRVVEEWLANEEDLLPVQRDMLQEALVFFEELCREQGDDPSVRFEAACAWERVGRIQKKMGAAAKSEAAFGEALTRLEALATERPAAPEYRHALARCLNSLGGLLKQRGRRGEAERAFQRGAALAERLAADAPGDPAHRHLLAECRSNLAAVLLETKRPREAEQAVQGAQQLLEKLVADRPADGTYRRTLVALYNNRGAHLLRTGRKEDAEKSYRAGLALLKRALDDSGGMLSTEEWFLEGILNKNLGLLLFKTGRAEEGERAMREAARGLGRLNDIRTREHRYREPLAAACVVLGDRCWNTNRLEEAANHYRLGHVHYQKLAREAPDNRRYKEGLAEVSSRLARVLRRLKLPEAVKAARQVLEAAERDLPGQDTPAGRHRLALRALEYAELLDEMASDPKRDTAAVEAAFRRPIEILRRLAEEQPKVPAYRKGLTRAHTNLGFTLMRAGRLKDAAEQWRLALKYDPKNKAAQHNLKELSRALEKGR